MPAKSLREIIRDQDGQLLLGQTASPGVAAQSPTAAAGQGASPDAAKMAGTPASGGAALGIGAPTPDQGAQAPAPLVAGTEAGAGAVQAPVPETQRLREVMRQEQAAQQTATAQQADKQAEAARMQTQFGDLGSRVQTLIDKYLPAPAAPSTPPGDPSAVVPGGTPPVAGIVGDVSKLTPEQQAAVQAVASTGGTPESIAAAKRLGVDPFAYLTNKDSISTGVAGIAAAATPDKIMLDDATIEQLGYTPDSLAAALGIPQEQLAGMSLEQMQQQMETRLRAEYDSTRAAAARATDATLGPNERAEARAELKQLGAAGVFATDADMHRLEQSIDAADEIMFAGKSMKIAEVLDDDFMTGLVKNYVDSPADSDARKRLREEAPQLAAWIDQNESALREASLQLEGASTKYNEIQESATAATQALTSVGLSKDATSALLEQLIPGSTSGFLTEAVDLTQFPGLGLLTDAGALQAAGMDPNTYAKNFAAVAAASPEAAAALARLSATDLAKLGAGDMRDPRFSSYIAYVQKWTALEAVDDSDPEAVIDFIFGPSASVESIQRMWDTEAAKARLGAPSDWFKQNARILDKDKDGKLDDAATMSGSLKGLLGDGVAIQDPSKLDRKGLAGINPGAAKISGNSTLGKLLSAAADGTVTAKELNGANLAGSPLSELLTIDTSAFDAEAKVVFSDVIGNSRIGSAFTSILEAQGLPKDFDVYGVVPGATNFQKQRTLSRAMEALAAAYDKLENPGPQSKRTYEYQRGRLETMWKKFGGGS